MSMGIEVFKSEPMRPENDYEGKYIWDERELPILSGEAKPFVEELIKLQKEGWHIPSVFKAYPSSSIYITLRKLRAEVNATTFDVQDNDGDEYEELVDDKRLTSTP
jgi:hypothetical protein